MLFKIINFYWVLLCLIVSYFYVKDTNFLEEIDEEIQEYEMEKEESLDRIEENPEFVCNISISHFLLLTLIILP